MKYANITIVLALISGLVVPQVLVLESEAKTLPVPNFDHTRGQMAIMVVIPALLVGGLGFALAYARMN
jgi:hypothetical protein